jgi:O-acetyl-ADP-ribose deacetylase (regulator of RNase III)
LPTSACGNLIGLFEWADPADALSRIEIVRGSIVDLDVDAIVNAANSALQGGGGVDGAIHRAAGPGLALEAMRLAPCPTGEAWITGGHNLVSRHVIHTVGPVWRGGSSGEPALLASCYRSSLALAADRSLATIAFPGISTGIYGYPIEPACEIASREVAAWLDAHEHPEQVLFCMFSDDSAAAMARALRRLDRPDLVGVPA